MLSASPTDWRLGTKITTLPCEKLAFAKTKCVENNTTQTGRTALETEMTALPYYAPSGVERIKVKVRF